MELDGSSSSDPDDDPLAYYWYFDEQPINSNLTSGGIAGGSTASASFTADVPGVWVLGLLVSDGLVNSAPSLISLQVSPGSCP